MVMADIEQLGTSEVIKLISKTDFLKAFINSNNVEETARLYNIIEENINNDQLLTGAYILLGNDALARKHFELLDDVIKEEFMRYPIVNLWSRK